MAFREDPQQPDGQAHLGDIRPTQGAYREVELNADALAPGELVLDVCGHTLRHVLARQHGHVWPDPRSINIARDRLSPSAAALSGHLQKSLQDARSVTYLDGSGSMSKGAVTRLRVAGAQLPLREDDSVYGSRTWAGRYLEARVEPHRFDAQIGLVTPTAFQETRRAGERLR